MTVQARQRGGASGYIARSILSLQQPHIIDPMNWRSALYLNGTAALILLSVGVSGQTLITVGSGNVGNGPNSYPAPYGNAQPGARHQMLIPASELQAAGMSEGTISSVAFNVANAVGITLQSFSISIGTTATTDLNPTWETGLSSVFGPTTHLDVQGWNTHVLDATYYWDGVSNLIVETCFSNGFAGANAEFFQTSTSYNSTIHRATPNTNVCTFNGGNIQADQQRPDMRFEWTPPLIAPVAAFSASSLFTCTGTVTFTDLSNYQPTSWAWDFGDGNTDTLQNPVHDYLIDGDYSVTLIATNAYGSDTTTLGPITVSVNTPLPVAACTPQSQGSIAGFGITSVSVNGNSTTSADASVEGYADRTCIRDTVQVGTLMDVAVACGSATTHNIRGWCDWDNSGTFTANEEVLSANSVASASGSVLVPAFATLNAPLRLRLIADYDFSAIPAPCQDPQYGQAEDYTIVVVENPLPPIAAFSADPIFTCNGLVQFSDSSLNTPTSWQWQFGDGDASTDASPAHTYLNSGTYTVQLIASNANGADTLLLVDLVTVDLNGQLSAASCTPQTQSYCCGYGILGVNFAGISTTSPDGVEGYQDRSCGNTATVEEGTSYPISVSTDAQNPHDVYVWLDLNNDSSFGNDELIYFALNVNSPNGNVLIPAATALNTPVRMRVIADVIGEIAGPCDQPLFGQAEDYSVLITPNNDPPSAAFTATPTQTCDGIVQFTDLSSDLPTSWAWTFGDGGTSTDQNPLYTYTTTGTYTVSLTVTNANGSDLQTQNNYITYFANNVCDTTIMPGFMDGGTNACTGTLTDDGGANADYTPGMSGSFTIAPAGAEVVALTFSQFAFETNFDYLRIFDGPDNNAPLLYDLTGNGVGTLPNGGVITSTGGSITVQQAASNGPTTWEGFVCTWECSFTGIDEATSDPILNIYPQPAADQLMIQLSNAPSNSLRITLHDALGRVVLEQRPTIGASSITVDVSALAGGLYTLSATTKDGRWSRNVVID